MQLSCLFKARDPSRSIIALSGKGVKDFLQGLNTNDVCSPEFVRGTCQYGCFLSGTGRTLFDGFMVDISLRNNEPHQTSSTITTTNSPQTSSGEGLSAPPPSSSSLPTEMILVDVSENVKDLAIQHFKDFKLRRKIKIVDVSSQVGVYVETIRTAPSQQAKSLSLPTAATLAREQAIIDKALTACDFSFDSPLMMPDPRYTAVEGTLGDFSEIEVPEGQTPPPPLAMTLRRGYKFYTDEELRKLEEDDRETHDAEAEGKVPTLNDNSTQLRCYRSVIESLCGIPTGPRTFAPQKGLPFEGNIDQLWAVSFEKGCYLGQELTHRTHVMLVSRKRVVPLVLGHYDTREEIFGVEGSGTTATPAIDDATKITPKLSFNTNELSLSGVDFTINKSQIWGQHVAKDTEYILKTSPDSSAEPTVTSAATNKSKSNKSKIASQPTGNKLYYLDETRLASQNADNRDSRHDPTALVPVGHVTQGQYNIGAGLVRLRYMNPLTRTMKLYIKREIDEDLAGNCDQGVCYASCVPTYVPVTAFIPLWWADEVVEKVLGASEAGEAE